MQTQQVQDALNNLPTREKREIVVNTIDNLSTEERKAMDKALGLGGPSDTMRDQLWKIVIWSFAVVLVGSFVTLALSVFLTIPQGATSPQIILTVFTSVVGFLAGLFAPSPVAKGEG
jgi:hypothetical protein